MKIGIIGAGHVGLVTGACFADLGHQVMMVDDDRRKVAALRAGRVPFFEPGLEELVRRGMAHGRLRVTRAIPEAVDCSTLLFVCVGTPTRPNGEADLSAVETVTRRIARSMRAYRLVVEKSTVPVQTGAWMRRTLREMVRRGVDCDVASNPEFLREGCAIQDFLHPDRIVIGAESERARRLLVDLYTPFHAPLVVTDVSSAELLKHASNSFLALKISYINAVAQVCERVGADVVKVADGMGLDRRIGRAFLDAGVGWGGSCFSKDVAAFTRIATAHRCDASLLRAAAGINRRQRPYAVARLRRLLGPLRGRTVGVLGLAFKPDTDDLRDAPALDIVPKLRAAGARVRVFDPKAMPAAKKLLGRGVTFCRNAYEAARGADAVMLLTEWNEFKELDVTRMASLMRQPVVFDGRNLYDPAAMRRAGMRYAGIGRGQMQQTAHSTQHTEKAGKKR
ncbi:MAG: UDP-glucose/GDP-mannose dehydrogenase family protein [Candidatus Omnitrophica bacterium]|nr:UDP-glucose/GDP-mannose dehydrogenase family protein [Candidatus Omnitrophota bacterium]